MGRRNTWNSTHFTTWYGRIFVHCNQWRAAKCVKTYKSQRRLWVWIVIDQCDKILSFTQHLHKRKCTDQILLCYLVSIVPPMVWIPHQLVGIPIGYNVSLECFIEAHPISLNYWSKEDNEMIHDSAKYKWSQRHMLFSIINLICFSFSLSCLARFSIRMLWNRTETVLNNPTYKSTMRLTIYNVQRHDYGTYKCVAKNPRGETDGTIRLYCEYFSFVFFFFQFIEHWKVDRIFNRRKEEKEDHVFLGLHQMPAETKSNQICMQQFFLVFVFVFSTFPAIFNSRVRFDVIIIRKQSEEKTIIEFRFFFSSSFRCQFSVEPINNFIAYYDNNGTSDCRSSEKWNQLFDISTARQSLESLLRPR